MRTKSQLVQMLLSKAGRTDTPEEEARTCALQAAQIFVREKLKITEESEGSTGYFEYEVPDFDSADFQEIALFSHEVALRSMQCAKCKKEIRQGQTFARETQTKTPRVTHYECRDLFTAPKG